MHKPLKPKYHMASNILFMIREACHTCKSVLLFVILLTLAGVGINLLELYVTPTVLRTLEQAGSLTDLLWVIAAFAGGLLLLDAARRYLEANVSIGRITVRLQLVLKLHDKMCQTSYPHMEDPCFLDRMNQSMDVCFNNVSPAEKIWEDLTVLFINVISLVLWLTVLSSLHPAIVALTLLLSLADYAVATRLGRWGYLHRDKEARYVHQMDYATRLAKDYRLAKDLRIFGMGSWIQDMYQGAMQLYQDYHGKVQRSYLLADIFGILLSFLRNGIAYLYLIFLVTEPGSGLDGAGFVLYFTALGGFTGQVAQILSQLTLLHRKSLSLSLFREFLDSEEPFAFEDGLPLSSSPGKSCELTLEHVSFRYPGAQEDTLHDISLTIRPGEKLAVVGCNGAGKTTLIKLLCGFYDPTQGKVLLNGEDIRPCNRRDYYQHFSLVSQNFSAMAASIAENVAQAVMPEPVQEPGPAGNTSYGKHAKGATPFPGLPSGSPPLDLEKVRHCIRLAGLAEKVESLPEGYHTTLNKQVFDDAAELSGGQLQRLMLARALYQDRPIMVLDEPTAALDPLAEHDIYQKYNELTAGRTSIFISHRLASTRFCDRIILLEDGHITETGTHEELLALGGHYAALFQVQGRYYNAGPDVHGSSLAAGSDE